MLLDIRDLGDTEIEPVHGRLLRLAEIDLPEQRLADAQRLGGGQILEGLVPRLPMDVCVVPNGLPETGGAEGEERGHVDGQGSGDPQWDGEDGTAGHAIRSFGVP